MMATYKEFILKARPQGVPTDEEVVLVESELPEIGDEQILVRNLYISLDPAIRGWMSDAPNYLPPIPLGTPVWATTLGRVVESKSGLHKEGDLVVGFGTWGEYSVQDAAAYSPVVQDDAFPLSHSLSILGFVGFTSYFGLLDVGQPKEGETVLVSAAAGAVGSVVGQIAKIKGCRVVGIAGGEDKCQRLLEEYGFDAAIDYKASANQGQGMVTAIADACPNGVDVYFDNVGGEILDAALMNLNHRARVPVCGAISSYNTTDPVPGPYNFWQVVVKSARIEGFLIRDYIEQFAQAHAEMGGWLKAGKIKHREEIFEGLENTLTTFNKLFSGENQGKLIQKIAEE